MTPRAWTPQLAAAATLALGFADLARGGATISAICLVIGYVVLLPMAILRWPARTGRAR